MVLDKELNLLIYQSDTCLIRVYWWYKWWIMYTISLVFVRAELTLQKL